MVDLSSSGSPVFEMGMRLADLKKMSQQLKIVREDEARVSAMRRGQGQRNEGWLPQGTRTKAVVRRFGKIAKTGGQADGAPFQNQMVLRDRAIATSKKDLQQALVSSFRLHRTKLPFFTTHVFRERSRNKKRPKNDPFVLVFFSFFFRHVSLHCTVYWDAEQVLQLEHHPSCLVLHPGTGQVKSSQGLKVGGYANYLLLHHKGTIFGGLGNEGPRQGYAWPFFQLTRHSGLGGGLAA